MLIASFQLSSAEPQPIQLNDASNHGYYSLGISYLDPGALNASFATTGAYLLLGYQFSPALLDDSGFSVATEGKLSFGLKGEQHINDYDGGYVVRDGKLTYAASLVIKLNYAITNAWTIFATTGVDHFAWQYQLKDQNSIFNDMEFDSNSTEVAWGLGLDYQFTDITVSTEINSLGFSVGLTKAF